MTNVTLQTILLLLLLKESAGFRPSFFGNVLQRTNSLNRPELLTAWTRIPRGGSSDMSYEEGYDEADDMPQQAAAPVKEDEEENPVAAAIPTLPVNILFKTALSNPLIDTSLELAVTRKRTVASVKSTLSRMLPGKPPFESLQLAYEGVMLKDEQLFDEIIDDDDEEEEDDTMTLTLDMVPPVDPKFATEMQSPMQEMTSSDLLDAYTANAAAMTHNGMELFMPPAQGARETMLSPLLRQQANEIRKELTKEFPEKALELLEEETAPSLQVKKAEQRGQRYRAGGSGGSSKTTLRRAIQMNMNINWQDTIRNFCLFIFFGIFGGRSSISRTLLLLGAPSCFILQARPVKIAIKQFFYAAKNPPSILLSLLPAPQQAILSFNEAQAFKVLYGGGAEDDDVVEAPDDDDDNEDDDDYLEDDDDDDETDGDEDDDENE